MTAELSTIEKPDWLNQEDILTSAVKYLSSVSENFNWVGIYLLKGQYLELGSYVGAFTSHTKIPIGRGICGRAVQENQDLNIPDVNLEKNYLACSLETQSELVVLIRDCEKNIVGQIDIDSHKKNAFGAREEAVVQEVAVLLGEFWHLIKTSRP